MILFLFSVWFLESTYLLVAKKTNFRYKLLLYPACVRHVEIKGKVSFYLPLTCVIKNKGCQQAFGRKCCSAKGQLISEGHLGIFNSSKKRTKNFNPSRLGQKLKFSSLVFGRIEDTKESF